MDSRVYSGLKCFCLGKEVEDICKGRTDPQCELKSIYILSTSTRLSPGTTDISKNKPKINNSASNCDSIRSKMKEFKRRGEMLHS